MAIPIYFKGYEAAMEPSKLTVNELRLLLRTIPGDAVVHINERRTDPREYVTVDYDEEEKILTLD